MNWSGLSDSLMMTAAPEECPRCRASARLSRGICLGCLLGSALEYDIDPVADDFAAVLDAVPAPDTLWRLGNYEILEEIGRGGMGVIYRARQRHSRRIVALKRVLSYHADSRDTLARFRREAEAAASLDHPNILPIYEVGESEDGVPYFSMKYAPGGTLQELAPALRDDRRQIVRILARVTRAAQHAHRQGILHRDLKPGNILLDGRGEPLVSDFGLAKWLDASTDLTRTLTIFGTPGYIAPEQAEGPAANLSPAADIYSLGAILFDLLTGRPPFLGEHALAVIRQAADKPAPKLRSLVLGADKDLETICARCLEREPTARYHSAGDLAEDLERWLEGRPIIARPVSPPALLWVWARRNPMLAAAAAVVVLLVATVLFVQSSRSGLKRTLDADTIYKRSVTVLPFLDLDSVTSNKKFTKSLSVNLRAKVSQLGPASILDVADDRFAFPGVGTIDDVRAVCSSAKTRTALTGTVRSVDGKLRVSVRLVDAFWAKTLMQKRFTVADSVSSVEKLADIIAGEVSSALNGNSRLTDPPLDPALADRQARVNMEIAGSWGQMNTGSAEAILNSFDEALTFYELAITSAPSSSLARAKFALTATQRMGMAENQGEGQQPFNQKLLLKAQALAREAVDLNPESGYAHRAFGLVCFNAGKSAQARDELLAAIETDGLEHGTELLGSVTRSGGRPDLALRWYKVNDHWYRPFNAEVGEPPSPRDTLRDPGQIDQATIGDCWADLCADEKATTVYQDIKEPYDFRGWIGLSRLRLLQGDFNSAEQIVRENASKLEGVSLVKQIQAQVAFFSRGFHAAEQKYCELDDSSPGNGRLDGSADFYGAVNYKSALGRIGMLYEENIAARALLEQTLQTERGNLTRRPSSRRAIYYQLAAIESSLGEKEAAIGHLSDAANAGWLDHRSPALDPRFDFLRDDDRFHEILKAMSTRVDSLRQSLLADWKD